MTDPDFPFPDLQTPRLSLRLLTLDDSEAVFRHFSDERVTRYMDIEPCADPAEAREIIEFHINDTGCRWGLFARDGGDLIGTCGYHCWSRDADGHSRAEIGYDLGRAHWGQGLMQEVLGNVIPFGFAEMGLAEIFAGVEPGNQRSIRLLRRLGFQQETDLRDGLVWLQLFRNDSSRSLGD